MIGTLNPKLNRDNPQGDRLKVKALVFPPDVHGGPLAAAMHREEQRGAGFAGRLGNTANYSYASSEPAQKRLSKWQAQDIARAVLGEFFRTSYCMVRQTKGQTAIYVNGEGKAYYKGLMTCGSVWVCPVCSQKIAARRAEQINEVIARFGFEVVLITYTLQHSIYDKLEKLLGDLRDALTYTLNGRFRQRFYDAHNVVGSIRSIEHRVSLSTGWHPHAHELLLLKKGTIPEVEHIKQFLMERYGKRLESKGYRVNDHTIDVRTVTQKPDNEVSDYLTKSVIELELTAGQNKPGASFSPFQLLAAHKETGEEIFADLFREYANVTRGKRWINWTHQLKQLADLEEESDEEIAAENEGGEEDKPIALLSDPEWQRVCMRGLRGQLLRVAEKSDLALLAWLHANQIVIGESDILVPSRPPPPKMAVGSGK